MFPNEMIARFWVGVLLEEGIHSMVKPRMGGYGMWGHDSFIPHGLYVMEGDLAGARALMAESDVPADGSSEVNEGEV